MRDCGIRARDCIRSLTSLSCCFSSQRCFPSLQFPWHRRAIQDWSGSQWTSADVIFHSSMLQKTYLEWVVAARQHPSSHPHLPPCREDLGGCLVKSAETLSKTALCTGEATLVVLAAELKLPSPPASWGRRTILGRFNSQWTYADPLLPGSELWKLHSGQCQELESNTCSCAPPLHTTPIP